MTTHKFTIAALGALAFAVPAAAEDAPTTTPTPQQQCRTERNANPALFKATYGTNANKSNAFGKCVSKRASATEDAQEEAHTNAAKQCKADRTADAAAFAVAWGNGKNAYGKCVSTRAKAQTTETVKAEVKSEIKAMKSCGAERKADPAAFKAKYGTNKTKSNAMGKCVSALAKAQQDDQETQTQS
jgi:hypothetical protein